MPSFRLRDWFFINTSTATKRGTRFKNGDRPPRATFDDMLHSTVMRSEAGDRAKEENGTLTREELNGHVVASTDAQAKAYQAKKTDRTYAVQPSQLTESAAGGAQEIANAGFNDNVIEVNIDNTETRRNKFLFTVKQSFLNVINGIFPRLLPSGGTTGQYLAKTSNDDYQAGWVDPCCDNVTGFSLTVEEDIPDDADIIAIYDTSSFSGASRTQAVNLMETWYQNYITSKPAFLGELIQFNDSSEEWLDFANKYIDAGRSYTPVKRWKPDGTGGFTVESTASITDPDNKKCVFIIFLDESHPDYHQTGVGNMQDPPTATFRSHYNDFKDNQYGKYDFFRAVMYAVQSSVTPTGATANLHSNVIQAIEPSTLASAPFSYSVANASGFNGTQLDFITADNFYEQATDVDSPTGYSGLRNLGWTYVVDMPNGDVSSITNSAFEADLINALSGGDGLKTVTITGTVTLQSGAQFSDSVAFEVPTS